MEINIILTPISNKINPNGVHQDGTRNIQIKDSKRDYLEQLKKQNEPITWDIQFRMFHMYNIKIGDIFIFIFNNIQIKIHTILWIDEHINRNRLYLSPEICCLPWSEWIIKGGYSRLIRNTMVADKTMERLHTNIKGIVNNN
jgi:hypothetical protein